MMYGGGTIKKPVANIQLAKASDARGLQIGEVMTVLVTGKITAIEGPKEDICYHPEGGKTKMMPGCISMEIQSIDIESDDSEEKGDDDV